MSDSIPPPDCGAGSTSGVGPARGWAARPSQSAPAGWASRHHGVATPAPLPAPVGTNSQRAWPVFAAAAAANTAAAAVVPRFSSANGGSKQQPMRAAQAGSGSGSGVSPLASVTAAFSVLQGRIAGATASLLTAPGWGRAGSINPHATQFASQATTRPFASVTSSVTAVPSSSPFGGAASDGAPPAAGSTAVAVAAAAAAKAEVGRATWTLLHMLAAQFPERPTRQQQRDARALVDCLTRIYPCGDCARHFAELVRLDPPVVSSGTAFRRWLCRTHNHVNSRLGKPSFNCDMVEARWAPLGCSAAEAAAGEEGLVGGGGGAEAGCELLGAGSKGSQRRRGGG
ncbi:hypothetical protein PLESTB_000073600 [Pleodorina starrii]|uniref:Sulfhydryl oxidase n=1 Tax=Pleodorina starrii TaxID=330485 RepID=A0A9W6B9S4_9CHLO|nr:hypothetical protein PLESTB_000073600 [Pleodorina starrii]GLC66524.1 hypothetical protein PLESTF_000439900 [Pleodorina starrii]